MNHPEASARENIDRQLMAAGWLIQDKKDLSLSASRGVGVLREDSDPYRITPESAQRLMSCAPSNLSPAPRGRNTPAQGNALGPRPTMNASPERAAQDLPFVRFVEAGLISGAQDPHLRQGRQPRRGHRRHRPQGVWQRNNFCKKVIYRASGKSEDIIKAFRTAPEKRRRLVGVLDGMSEANAARRVSRRAEPANQFRIAVTVDMIATGTDIKPLECLLFLRDVRSQLYFEQMKGRGTRTIDPDALASVTPDAGGKTRFVLVDAVGVTESDKSDSRPMESKPSVAFDKLLLGIGHREPNKVCLAA